jgi:Na+/H+-dicarboxylate symporter
MLDETPAMKSVLRIVPIVIFAVPATFVILTSMLGLLAFFDSLVYLYLALLLAWSCRSELTHSITRSK